MNKSAHRNTSNQKEYIGFQVDGKIINELSKQVSSHLFALGELLKNSYDAQATKINITLDMQKSILIIEDNGLGISLNNIQSLFHIAKSEKTYGKENSFWSRKLNNDSKISGYLFVHKIESSIIQNGILNHPQEIKRYTQGSKGLGLLSAFKFGNIVNWNTSHNNIASSITINKQDIISESDITQATFPLNQGTRLTNGTTITINLDPNDSEISFIYEFLMLEKNHERLVNFFIEDNLEVHLKLINKDGKINSPFPLKTIYKSVLNKELPEKKTFDIIFDSESNVFTFIGKNKFIKKVNNIVAIDKNKYYIKFRLNAYSFKSGDKSKISKIFYNGRNDLTPLVYINGVLFNNDHLFDPSIPRTIRSSESLPQLTGFIEIICTNPNLEFNNERTDLVSTSFNSKLRGILRDLNIFLQREGKKLEKIQKSNILKNNLLPPYNAGINSTGISNANNPADNSDTTNPVDTSDTTNPADTSDTTNPADTSDTTNPADTSDTTNPADASDTTNLATTSDTTNPADTSDTTNPADTSDTTNPAANSNTTNFNNDIRPHIELTASKQTINVYHFPYTIDLKSFLLSATDRYKNTIDIKDLTITVDGRNMSYPFIEQIHSPKVTNICYSFEDKFSTNSEGKYIKYDERITLIFNKKDYKFNNTNNEDTLIKPIGKNYTFAFSNVKRLIDQLNKLWIENNEYDMCISASIRLLFDISTYNYENCSGNQFSKKSLEFKVPTLIQEILADSKHFTEVYKLLDSRHSSVENIFEDHMLFANKVSRSNLGSHAGSIHLPADTIRDLALYAGYYAQLVDAHCKVKGWIS